MTYQEVMQKLQNGGIEAEDAPTGSRYNPATIKIAKTSIVDGDNPSIEHPLVKSQIGKGIVWVAFNMEVKLEDGTKVDHVEVTRLYTSKGRLNYSSEWTDRTGETVPESFLHELKRRCSEYDPKQASKFPEKFVFTEDLFKGMIFEIDVRETQNGYLYLGTAKQLKDDEEYRNKKAAEEAQHNIAQPVVNAVDDDELPF